MLDDKTSASLAAKRNSAFQQVSPDSSAEILRARLTGRFYFEAFTEIIITIINNQFSCNGVTLRGLPICHEYKCHVGFCEGGCQPHYPTSLQTKFMAPLLVANLSKPQFIINYTSVLPSQSVNRTAGRTFDRFSKRCDLILIVREPARGLTLSIVIWI